MTFQSSVHSTKNKNNRQKYKYNGNIRRLLSLKAIMITFRKKEYRSNKNYGQFLAKSCLGNDNVAVIKYRSDFYSLK